MNPIHFGHLGLLGALTVLSVCLLGCGGQSPGTTESPIARVGAHSIPRTEFDRSFAILARVARRADVASPRLQRQFVRRSVVAQLIRGEWLEQEAVRRHVRLTPGEVKAWYDAKRAAGRRADVAGGDASTYRATLAIAHDAPNGRRSPVRVELLQQKLVKRNVAGQTDEVVRAYYARNRERFRTVEYRHFYYAVAKQKVTVERARRVLERGAGWRAVSAKYSIENYATLEPGSGGLKVTAPDSLEPALNRAVYSATPTTLSGPVKASKGWYLIEVTKIEPPEALPLSAVATGIKAQLAGDGYTKATAILETRLRRTYLPKTHCAPGFRVAGCRNASKLAGLPSGP